MKLNRVSREVKVITPENINNETQETETLQVMTSESPIDISEQTLGMVQIRCIKCTHILTISRELGIKLSCPECGTKQFISLSNFIMECPEKQVIVRVGDNVFGSRGGTGIWKVF